MKVIKDRVKRDEVIVSGSSAGSMIYNQLAFGYGSSYGAMYFANSDGLAPKTVKDASVGGSNLADTRNGSDCLQFR